MRSIGVVPIGSGREIELACRRDTIACQILPITTTEGVADRDWLTVIRVPLMASRIVRGILDILSDTKVPATA